MEKFFKKELNSKGAVSIFISMSILAAVLAIAIGSSVVVVTEKKMSSDSSDSMKAYFMAEAGIEKAIYDIKSGNEPAGAAVVCTAPGTCDFPTSEISADVDGDSADDYTLYITGCLCSGSLTGIKAIGKFDTIRRSIEITF